MLLIDKAAGPTSHDVVAAVRRQLGVRRAGHCGTLDPFATGLLVVLVGRATRLSRFLLGLNKEYSGTIRLGTSTDTDDGTGTVTASSDEWRRIGDDAVRQGMTALTGCIAQTPPDFSAKKIGGTPAHRRVRRGEVVALPPQSVRIEAFTFVRREGPDVEFTATVGSGTYVRALARDLGAGLGCGAHLRALRRFAVGPFSVTDAVSLPALDRSDVRPPGDAVQGLSRLEVTAADRDALQHGQAISTTLDQDEPVALFTGSELIAVAEVRRGLLKPRVVLAE